jgi:hypothetical protein
MIGVNIPGKVNSYNFGNYSGGSGSESIAANICTFFHNFGAIDSDPW